MTSLLHGDALISALVPIASALIGAVHSLNADEISALFAEATQLAGDHLTAARALTVLLAAWCSEDHAPAAALGWTVNPAEYQRLRSSTDALTASLRAGRTTEKEGPTT